MRRTHTAAQSFAKYISSISIYLCVEIYIRACIHVHVTVDVIDGEGECKTNVIKVMRKP